MTSPSTERRRFRLDASVERHGRVLIGGSPLKLFRVTDAGVAELDRLAAGDPVAASPLTAALLAAGAIHPVAGGFGRFGRDDVATVVPAHGPPRRPPTGALVVDDGSTPPLDGAAVRLARNRGPGAARNAGLERVTTPLVAFVDADVDVTDDWLDGLLPHFDDERVALVAPRVRSSPGRSRLAAYEVEHSPLDLGDRPGRVRAGSRVGYVPAAAIVCRVAAIRSIGGFDTDLRFGEDVDLVWRLVEAGWTCRYEPDVAVVHAPRATWRAWLDQRVSYGGSAAPLARRHPGALAPLRTNGWSLGAWVLGALGRPALGVLLGVGSAAALVGRLPDVPARAAFRLAATGNIRAGEQIATAIRRTWWPLLAIAALRSRSARRALVAALVSARGPLVAVDDLAYSIGVWRGMVAERTAAPLIPDVTSWPGRGARRPTPSHYRPGP